MKTCLKCKIEYGDDKKFCKSCGGQLSSTQKADPKFSARKMVLEEKIKAEPLNVVLLSELAQLFKESSFFDDALLTLYKILAIDENNLKAQELLFTTLKSMGKTKEAAEIGYKLAHLLPDNLNMLLEVALLAIDKGDNTQALDYLERIVKKDPKQKEAWKQKASLLYKTDKRADSFVAWNSVYKIDPDDIEARLYLGIEADKKGEYVKSKEYIESVIEKIEDKTRKRFLGLVYLAKAYMSLNQDTKSISDIYTKIIDISQPKWRDDEIKPLLCDIALFLGQKALDKNDFNNALSYFKNVEEYGNLKKSKEASAIAYYKMSEEYFAKKDYKNAEYYINESLKLDPTNSEVKTKHLEILDSINVTNKKQKRKRIIIVSGIALCILAAIVGIKTIKSINENDLWNEAKTINTLESYSNYLKLYPDGKYIKEANASKEKVSFFIDERDGKKYRIVVIGKQIWMAENLYFATTTGSWFHNNSPENGKKYGRLYNWETAQFVCPEGWRLPTRTEFETLSAEVNGDGNALKEVGQGEAHNGINGVGTNTSGFSAKVLAINIGYDTNFWSSTESGSENAYYLHVDYYGNAIRLYDDTKDYGYSVRCVKDNNKTDINSIEEIEQKSVGEWVGKFGKYQILIVLEQIENNYAKGYNILNGKKRSISGYVKKTNNSLIFELNEPGDDKWDGTFRFNILNGKLEGNWKSNNGKITRNFVLSKQ